MSDINLEQSPEQEQYAEACDISLNLLYKAANELKKVHGGELAPLDDNFYTMEAKLFRAKRLFEQGHGLQDVQRAIPDVVRIFQTCEQLGNEWVKMNE